MTETMERADGRKLLAALMLIFLVGVAVPSAFAEKQTADYHEISTSYWWWPFNDVKVTVPYSARTEMYSMKPARYTFISFILGSIKTESGWTYKNTVAPEVDYKSDPSVCKITINAKLQCVTGKSQGTTKTIRNRIIRLLAETVYKNGV